MLDSSLTQCIAISLGWAGVGYDIGIIGGLLVNQRWLDEYGRDKALLGIIIASFIFGATIASPLAAFLGDRTGRRSTILSGCILNIIAVCIQAASISWPMLFVGRIITGCATAFILTNSPPYLVETCSHHQTNLTALSPTAWFIGAIASSWIGFGVLSIHSDWSWRTILILRLPWTIAQMIVLCSCPESPRWLYMRGRESEARAALKRTMKQSSDHEIQQRLDSFTSEHNPSSWISLLLSQKYRRRLIIICLLGFGTPWLGTGIANSYLPPFLASLGIRDQRHQAALNGGVQISNLIVAVIAAFQTDRLGRRRLLIISAIGILLSMSSITICAAIYAHIGSVAASTIAVVSVFFLFISDGMGLSTIPQLYVTELMPTQLHVKAPAISGFMSGIAQCMNFWLNPIALNILGWKYLLVFDACCVLMVIALILIAPETRDRTMQGVMKRRNDVEEDIQVFTETHIDSRSVKT